MKAARISWVADVPAANRPELTAAPTITAPAQHWLVDSERALNPIEEKDDLSRATGICSGDWGRWNPPGRLEQRNCIPRVVVPEAIRNPCATECDGFDRSVLGRSKLNYTKSIRGQQGGTYAGKEVDSP